MLVKRYHRPLLRSEARAIYIYTEKLHPIFIFLDKQLSSADSDGFTFYNIRDRFSVKSFKHHQAVFIILEEIVVSFDKYSANSTEENQFILQGG